MTLTRLYALQCIRLLDQTLSNIQSFSIIKTDSFVSPFSENSWTDYPDYVLCMLYPVKGVSAE